MIRRNRHHDRGSGTLLGMFLVATMLIFGGTLVEVANAQVASAQATDIAQEAARAGAAQLDLGTLRADGSIRIDPAAAQAAALTYLHTVDQTGTVTATPTQISVTVTITRNRVLLPLIGIRTLQATSTATATPLTD